MVVFHLAMYWKEEGGGGESFASPFYTYNMGVVNKFYKYLDLYFFLYFL